MVVPISEMPGEGTESRRLDGSGLQAPGSGEEKVSALSVQDVSWTVVGALNAIVEREGVTFNVSIQKGGGVWLALAFAARLEGENALEMANSALDSHAHKLLVSSPSLAHVMEISEIWLSSAPVPESLCDCEEA